MSDYEEMMGWYADMWDALVIVVKVALPIALGLLAWALY